MSLAAYYILYLFAFVWYLSIFFVFVIRYRVLFIYSHYYMIVARTYFLGFSKERHNNHISNDTDKKNSQNDSKACK
jgi:hypothetical protein